jgi:hypothetical protein
VRTWPNQARMPRKTKPEPLSFGLGAPPENFGTRSPNSRTRACLSPEIHAASPRSIESESVCPARLSPVAPIELEQDLTNARCRHLDLIIPRCFDSTAHTRKREMLHHATLVTGAELTRNTRNGKRMWYASQRSVCNKPSRAFKTVSGWTYPFTIRAQGLKVARQAKPANQRCADCTEFDPRYVSTKFGVYVCLLCAGTANPALLLSFDVRRIKAVSMRRFSLRFFFAPRQIAGAHRKCLEVQGWGNIINLDSQDPDFELCD